ncbi:hypothetical protein QUA42_04905 [Microcoleus sp. Pol11C2]
MCGVNLKSQLSNLKSADFAQKRILEILDSWSNFQIHLWSQSQISTLQPTPSTLLLANVR